METAADNWKIAQMAINSQTNQIFLTNDHWIIFNRTASFKIFWTQQLSLGKGSIIFGLYVPIDIENRTVWQEPVVFAKTSEMFKY
jgi:hypothetical protein